MSSRLLPLITLITVVWLLIFIGSYAIFRLIVPLPNISNSLEGRLFTSIFKVGASGLIVTLWIYVMLKIRNIYVKRRIYSKPEEER